MYEMQNIGELSILASGIKMYYQSPGESHGQLTGKLLEQQLVKIFPIL